ncbi:hypothetical protein GE09DRAFT_1294629 [Coniochaeta sp. 2T2.1]|nr:hypothetical protein GE09DRAFT_1294629 [Coniochaeta sp. 2T2.1]
MLAPAVASGGALLPCYHLPFRRNTRFVGRGAELDALKDLLFGRKSPSVALVGLGGVGKPQVALELAYWVKENHPEHSIFWVQALSGATFEQAYAEIAKKLSIRKAADDADVKGVGPTAPELGGSRAVMKGCVSIAGLIGAARITVARSLRGN